MARDQVLMDLFAERDRIKANIKEVEDDNVLSGSISDLRVTRPEVDAWEKQLALVQMRIRQRQAQLVKMPSPIWGQVVKVVGKMPDAYK